MNTSQPTQPSNWQTLRQVYDRRADEQYPLEPHRGPRHLSRKHRGIIAHLNFPPGSHVLDAGCGDGVYCEWLSRQDYARIIGSDLSPNILVTARGNVVRRGRVNITHFAAGNLEQLPFADESFDAIVCSQVIEHLPDDRAGFTELARVLRSPNPVSGKPGGMLVISTDNHDNRITQMLGWPIWLIRAILRRPVWHYPFPHGDYRMSNFSARLEQAGLQIKHAETFRFSWPSALRQIGALVWMLDWVEERLIRLPGFRNWGDILLVKAVKR